MIGIAFLIEYLNHRFTSYKRSTITKWSLLEWDNAGATYGLEIILSGEYFTVQQFLESGYVNGRPLVSTNNYDRVYQWAECFEPTNINYDPLKQI